MTLAYLLFDYSEGADGTGLFDAMATVQAAQVAAVEAEIAQVMAWAAAQFPHRAPVEDGGDWDAHAARSDAAGAQGQMLSEFTLSIGGSEAFCSAFASQFGEAVA